MTSAPPMLIVALWTAPAARVAEARELLGELARAARREAGCLRFDVHAVLDAPRRFALVEEYNDAEAFAAHRASEHFRRLVLEQAVPMGVEREVLHLAPLDTASAASADGEGR